MWWLVLVSVGSFVAGFMWGVFTIGFAVAASRRRPVAPPAPPTEEEAWDGIVQNLREAGIREW